MQPPVGPIIVDHLFGLPFLTLRWYGVLIMTGVLCAAWVAGRRAEARGIAAAQIWNLLLPSLVLSIVCARLYYVAFEWPRYADKPLLYTLNPQNGGIAIHGALIGALLAVLLVTRWYRLPLLPLLDICAPTVLIGQAIGRWGNFVNQEAYGRPTTLPWGLDIAPAQRIPPYTNLGAYPQTTRFHPTFLYESLWDISMFGLILGIERRWGARLRPGDSALLYGVLYSAGRVWIEGLRTDSLCVGPYTLDGSCAGGLRIAQLVSLGTLLVCGLLLVWRHRQGRTTPQDFITAEQ